jgi:hypothetical protein
MIEKFKEAAAALREAAEACTQTATDCTSRAAEYADLADRLDAITLTRAEFVGELRTATAKARKPRRGPAPKAGRKAKGKGRRIAVAIDGKKLADAVTPNLPKTKPNGHEATPTPAPEALPAAPAAKPVAFLTKADLERPAAAPATVVAAPAEAAAASPSVTASKSPSNKNVDRDERIVGIVAAHPGVHMSQIRLWLRDGKRGELPNPGTLHYVLNRLVSEKRILREGGGYHPVAQDATVN